MFQRVPQPGIKPALRDLEHHDFWPGFIAVLIGLVLVVCGAMHSTGVPTVDGGTASESQLMMAYCFDGLQYAERMAPPPPPAVDDPEALELWARQNAHTPPLTWKVRVDTAAKTPCPT